MSDRLSRAMGEAERRADSLTERAIQSLIAAPRGEGGSAFSDVMSRNLPYQKGVSLDHHREQYRHFTGWVYAAVRLIAQRIARQRIIAARHVKKAKDRNRINTPAKHAVPYPYKAFHQELDVLEEHEVLDVLAVPNEIMTRWMLMFVTVASLELTGKSYWWVYESKSGALKGRKVIWPIPSHWVEPIHDPDALYAKWRIRPDGTKNEDVVDGSEIIYFYYPDPGNPLGATSPLQAMARAVVADEAIAEAQRRTFLNDVWPGLALIVGRNPDVKTPGVPTERPILSKEQRAQTIAAVKNAYRGVQNYNEPLILDGFIQDAKRITMRPDELGFMNSGKYTKERITQSFGVNPIVMGEIEGANRSSAAVADSHVTENTINPKIALLSEILTLRLPPMLLSSKESLIIYVEEAVAFDPEQDRLDREQMLKYAATSINEFRQEKSLPPIHGGDVALLLTQQFTPIRIAREDKPLEDSEGPAQTPEMSSGAAPQSFGKPPASPAAPPANPPKPPQDQPANDGGKDIFTRNGV